MMTRCEEEEEEELDNPLLTRLTDAFVSSSSSSLVTSQLLAVALSCHTRAAHVIAKRLVARHVTASGQSRDSIARSCVSNDDHVALGLLLRHRGDVIRLKGEPVFDRLRNDFGSRLFINSIILFRNLVSTFNKITVVGNLLVYFF